MVKDLTLAIESGHRVGIDASMGTVAVKLHDAASKDPRCFVSSETFI